MVRVHDVAGTVLGLGERLAEGRLAPRRVMNISQAQSGA
jgi:hypothetical protein